MQSWGGRGHKYRVRLSTIDWPRLASLSVWIRVIDKCTPCINEGVSYCRKLANYELAWYKSEPGINCGPLSSFILLTLLCYRIGRRSGFTIIFGVFVINLSIKPVLRSQRAPNLTKGIQNRYSWTVRNNLYILYVCSLSQLEFYKTTSTKMCY